MWWKIELLAPSTNILWMSVMIATKVKIISMLLLYQFLHPRILRIQTIELHCGEKLVRFFAMAQFLALVILLIEILLQFQIALHTNILDKNVHYSKTFCNYVNCEFNLILHINVHYFFYLFHYGWAHHVFNAMLDT